MMSGPVNSPARFDNSGPEWVLIKPLGTLRCNAVFQRRAANVFVRDTFAEKVEWALDPQASPDFFYGKMITLVQMSALRQLLQQDK